MAAETSEDLENELAKFRNDWRKELTKETSSSKDENIYRSKNVSVYHQFPARPKAALNNEPVAEANPSNDLEYEQPQNNEQKAQYLFNKGVQLEQQSRHYEGNFLDFSVVQYLYRSIYIV